MSSDWKAWGKNSEGQLRNMRHDRFHLKKDLHTSLWMSPANKGKVTLTITSLTSVQWYCTVALIAWITTVVLQTVAAWTLLNTLTSSNCLMTASSMDFNCKHQCCFHLLKIHIYVPCVPKWTKWLLLYHTIICQLISYTFTPVWPHLKLI